MKFELARVRVIGSQLWLERAQRALQNPQVRCNVREILNKIQPFIILKFLRKCMDYQSLVRTSFSKSYCSSLQTEFDFSRPTPLSSLMTQYAFQENLIYSKLVYLFL